MLKVLIDYHHYELALSFCLLGRRLGWEVYLPNREFFSKYQMYGFPHDCFNQSNNEVKKYTGSEHIDIAISSIPHNYEIYNTLFKKCIQQIGNHEWTMKNFDHVITSDLFSYLRFRKRCNACYYYPEIDVSHYMPTIIENRNVRTYIQNIHMPYTFDRCKVCDTASAIERPDYSIFQACQKKLRKYNIELVQHGFTQNNLSHSEIPRCINDSRLTWHFKTIEGYGFSALASMLCGVPVMLNQRWLAGTTLGSLAILDKTAIYSEYNAKEIIANIKTLINKDHVKTQDICLKTIRGLLDFEYEAEKVKRFVEGIV